MPQLRSITISNARSFRNMVILRGLAVLAVVALLIAIGGLAFLKAPPANEGIVAIVATVALAVVAAIIFLYFLSREVLLVEFGERILVRKVFSRLLIEWEEVAELVLEPNTKVARLPSAPGILFVFTHHLTFSKERVRLRRIRLTLKNLTVIRSDIGQLEWEFLEGLAKGHQIGAGL